MIETTRISAPSSRFCQNCDQGLSITAEREVEKTALMCGRVQFDPVFTMASEAGVLALKHSQHRRDGEFTACFCSHTNRSRFCSGAEVGGAKVETSDQGGCRNRKRWSEQQTKSEGRRAFTADQRLQERQLCSFNYHRLYKNRGRASVRVPHPPPPRCFMRCGMIQDMKGRMGNPGTTDRLQISFSPLLLALSLILSACHTRFSSCILTPRAGLVISHYARSHLGNWAMQSWVMYAKRRGEAQWPASRSISPKPLATEKHLFAALLFGFYKCRHFRA